MLDMKEKSVKSMMMSGGKDAAPAAEKQEGQNGKGRRNKSKPLLCSRRPRVMQARTASPRVQMTGARVRVETKSIRAGITSKQRRDA